MFRLVDELDVVVVIVVEAVILLVVILVILVVVVVVSSSKPLIRTPVDRLHIYFGKYRVNIFCLIIAYMLKAFSSKA